MFSVLGSRMEHKKAIENQTAVYFCLYHEFNHFLSVFGHFCCFGVLFLIFLQCFSGIQKQAWKDVIHTVILAIYQKNQIKNFEEKFVKKKTHCPSIVTLALLLFFTLLVFHAIKCKFVVLKRLVSIEIVWLVIHIFANSKSSCYPATFA